MQKVEGSNPFSRSPESLAFAGLSAFLGATEADRLIGADGRWHDPADRLDSSSGRA